MWIQSDLKNIFVFCMPQNAKGVKTPQSVNLEIFVHFFLAVRKLQQVLTLRNYLFIYLFIFDRQQHCAFSLTSLARYLGGRDLLLIGQKESAWKCALTGAIHLKLNLHRTECCFCPEILFKRKKKKKKQIFFSIVLML